MKLNGERCKCSACGQYFSTTANFDKHRVGRHGVDRRCAYPGDVGLINRDGIWRGKPRDAHEWARLGRGMVGE